MEKIKSIFLMSIFMGLGTLFFGFGQAQAYDYPTPFVIDEIQVLHDGYLRIVDNGGGAHCTGGPEWSYVLTTDTGYKLKNAVLMLAYAQGKTVELVTETTDGICHIVDIMVIN